MGFASGLKKQALGLSQKALEKLFADEKRAMQIANALGAVQRGKKTLDDTQQAVMNQLNFATTSDFKSLGKAVGGLRRKAQALSDRLASVE